MDGDLLLAPQLGRLAVRTELGWLSVRTGEILIESGADVPYVGTACPKTAQSRADCDWLEAKGVKVKFRASLEDDLAAMEAIKPDLAIGTTPANDQMDMAGAAITMVCVMSERRLNRLTNPALSIGLPAFLTKGAGMMSGMMLSQYTADSLIVEQRILSMPASIQSIPAAADQEDFVSMGMNTALKNQQIIDNAYGVLGIEFMGAAQALDLREFQPGRGVDTARKVIREKVAFLDEDRKARGCRQPLHGRPEGGPGRNRSVVQD